MLKTLEQKVEELEKRIAALEVMIQEQAKEITLQIDGKDLDKIIHLSDQELPRQGSSILK